MSYRYNQHHLDSHKDYDGYIGYRYSGQKVKFVQNDSNDGYNYNVVDLETGNVQSRIREQCIPKLFNKIYKPEQSKVFNEEPKTIQEVLPNIFSMEDEGIKYSVRYDIMSVQEKFQIRSDIYKAYEVFKQNFSVNNIEKTLNLEIHVFNNRNDYIKYNGLSGIDADNTYGATNNETIIVYKFAGMDFVLGHELGHAFQHQLATGIDRALNGELVGNYIGAQVEEVNKKHIEEGNIKEYTAQEYEKTAHYNQLENKKDQEEQDIKKEMQNDVPIPEDSQDSTPGLPGIILSFFNNFISWVFGIEEKSKSSELPKNPPESINHHDEDNHYSSASDVI